MFFHTQQLINNIPDDEPNPAAANALQEGLGGQFGETRTMTQYLFQSFNARGDAKPFKDLIQGIGIEEIRVPTTPPKGFPAQNLPERPEEFAPGLTPELQTLVEEAEKMARAKTKK